MLLFDLEILDDVKHLFKNLADMTDITFIDITSRYSYFITCFKMEKNLLCRIKTGTVMMKKTHVSALFCKS